MRILITDSHHTPKGLIMECFSQPPPPPPQSMVSFILITLGIISVDGLKINLGLVRLGEYTVCILGDEVLPYRSPFAP